MTLDDFLRLTDENFKISIRAEDGLTNIMDGAVSSLGVKYIKDKKVKGFNIDFEQKKLLIYIDEVEE